MKAILRLLLAWLCLAPAAALAQGYPARPMRMVLPLPPGGAIDIVGRVTGGVVSERLGQPIVLFFMTLITGLIAFCFHQVTCLRGMGIMAENALPSV